MIITEEVLNLGILIIIILKPPHSYNTRFSQKTHRPYDPFTVTGAKGYDPKVSGIVNDAVFEFESMYNRRGP